MSFDNAAQFSPGELGRNSNVGPIKRSSSIGPGTAEVRSMIEQARAGRPTTAYEFAQGMVDYGKGKLPPPRIFIVRNGHKETFTGRIADRQGITAIEFTNSGGGLRPEETTTFHHEAEKDATLGQHGRGTTIALTYLASNGMRTEIESSYGGKAWEVTTSLEDTDTRLTKVLKVDGKWLDKPSDTTVFRVLDPTAEFLDQVDHLQDYFLPANPAMPDASIVERRADSPAIPLAYEVSDPTNGKKASVRCLTGVVSYEESDRNTIYVDGLKVEQQFPHEKCLFPWEIAGARDLSTYLKVARSSDSGKVDGGSDAVAALLQIALRHNEDPAIFTTLLDTAEKSLKFYEVPLELSPNAFKYGRIPKELQDFSEASKAVLLDVWTEKHQDAYVASDAKTVERFRRSGSNGRVVIIQEPMYAWLKEAGVPTLEDVGFVEAEKVRSGEEIEVDYVNDENKMERLFQEAGKWGGKVEVATVGGRKEIRIGFPYSIVEGSDYFDREKPGAQVARVAAIIAAKTRELEISIRSQKASKIFDLEFKVNDKFGKPGWFTTELEVSESVDRPTQDRPNGLTLVTLTGETLQGFDPPTAEDLARISREADEATRRERDERVRGLPVRQKQQRPEQLRSDDGTPRPQKKDKAHSSGQNRMRHGPPISRRTFMFSGAAVVASTAIAWKGGAVAGYFDKLLGGSPSRASSESGALSDKGYTRLYNDTNSISGENQIGGLDSVSVGVGVFEQDYKSGKSEQDVAFEPGTQGKSVEGYYRQFVGSKFVLDNKGRGVWIAAENYQAQDVSQQGAPNAYTTKTEVAGVDGPVRLPIRYGEQVIAIDSPSSAVTIKKEQRTGDFIADGSLGRLVYYTKEATPNTARPLPVESESILKVDSLTSDWQGLLGFLQSQQALTNEEKAALVLQKWSTDFIYSADSKYDKLGIGRDIKQVATQIVNGRHGVCNYAATGMVALLREAGVPARLVAGEIVNKLGKDSGPHAWMEFWNGKYWVELEPEVLTQGDQSGVQSTPDASTSTSTTTGPSNPDLGPVEAQRDWTQSFLDKNDRLLQQYKSLLNNPPPPSGKSTQSPHPQQQTPTPTSSRGQQGDTHGTDSLSLIKKLGPWVGTGLVGFLAGRAGRKKEKIEESAEEEKRE